MAILNRDTLKQKISDFINRVTPFTNPLIQKTEDLEIRSDVADSVIFKESTVGSIGAPGANFNVDFADNDEYNISTAASIGSAFNITLQNLRNNSVGKLNITKKTGDTFSFANGTIIPFNFNTGQAGVTSLTFLIHKIGNSYVITPGYTYSANQNFVDNSIPISNQVILSGIDFNTVIRPQILIIGSGGATINVPATFSGLGMLIVMQAANSGTSQFTVIQQLTQPSTGQIYSRSRNSSGTWTNWITNNV